MRLFFCPCSEHTFRMYKHLVFCGGGTRVLLFMPSLVLLENEGLLDTIHDYWGTSAGALLAAFMAITRSAKKTHKLLHEIQYTHFRDIDVGNLFNINRTWGLDDGSSLMREIERVFELIDPGASKKTLRDYPGIHIPVSDLNVHETVLLDSTTYPDLCIVDAIRATMSLPFLYMPYKYKPSGHYWIDGALRANFPWNLLPNDTARHEALGFLFEKAWIGGPRNFSDYMFSMIHFDEPKKMEKLKAEWPNNILWYPTPPYPAWYMGLNTEDFSLIEEIGKRIGHKWLELRQKDDSSCPLNKTETPGLCEGQNTHPPSHPQHCIDESSGSRLPCLEPSRDSSRPQSHCTLSSFRRWSV